MQVNGNLGFKALLIKDCKVAEADHLLPPQHNHLDELRNTDNMTMTQKGNDTELCLNPVYVRDILDNKIKPVLKANNVPMPKDDDIAVKKLTLKMENVLAMNYEAYNYDCKITKTAYKKPTK